MTAPEVEIEARAFGVPNSSSMPLAASPCSMLLAALEGPSELRYWLKFGGTKALASYRYSGGQELRPADVFVLYPIRVSDCIRFSA